MVMTKGEALRILELGQGSTPEEIRSSYKRLALKWHPDKHNNSTESTKKFQEISEAYKRLTSKDDIDDITITMADMFDLFAHIFFSNSGYFVNDHLFFSDDDDDAEDEYMYMNASSSDEDVPVYRSRQHHGKYSDLMASRVSRAAAAAYRNEMRKKQNQKVQTGISEEQARKNAEELIKEEEKIKKKAEKRRARKKRNRANRKQREKRQKADDQEAENDDESEDETTEDREKRDSSKENKNPTNKENSSRTNVNKNIKSGEDEDSDNERTHDETWDTSSAFFNHAARRGPVHTTNHTSNETTSTASADTSVYKNEHTTQTTQSNRTRSEESEKDLVVEQSRQLAAIGNKQANEGNYKEAIEYFTQAISLHNRDFRFFGNRSFCYDRLGDYSKALQDAEVTIMLVPHWAKGYFRKGRALAGLKQYADAEKAFQHVLKLDKHCEDAKHELTTVRVQQLIDMGFGNGQSARAVRLYGTVHAALDALLSGKVKNLVANEDEMYVSDGEVDEQVNDPRQRYSDPMASLWVGNIDAKQVTERQLTHLFSKFGTISLIRILPQSFCAFVNYENKECAARAMQSLQGYMIGGQNIRIRFQASDKSSKTAEKVAKPTGPVNGNECYFWRTTGCVYGDKCHYLHIPGNRGIDIEKVEQKYGKIKKKR